MKGMNTTEIAIGNNLLIEKWIEYTVKLNRAFVVRRNLPVRELLDGFPKSYQNISGEILPRKYLRLDCSTRRTNERWK